MPSWGTVEVDHPRWRRCLNQAGAAMQREGWKPYARKFDQVRERRALRLYNGT